jgi:predicted O-methyltransferase YrrM
MDTNAELEASLELLDEGAAKCKTVEDYIRLVQTYRGRGPYERIAAAQINAEFAALMKRLQKENIRYACEIGTMHGGTLFLLTRVALEDAVIVSIDLPGGPFGGGYGTERVPFFERMARAQQRVHCLRKDSKRIETQLALEKILKDQYLDYLFIDGDHSYEGVKSDFENYRRYVRKGGLIVFHDILGAHPKRQELGVKMLWEELKPRFTRRAEYVSDAKRGYAGIGALRVQ